MIGLSDITVDDVMQVLEGVADPEIPVISIVDLGIVREVRVTGGTVEVDLTPTYSGCPALDVIPIMVAQALEAAGFEAPVIRNVLAPAWTTDWISESGKQKLEEFGIAPPHRSTDQQSSIPLEDRDIKCPQCGSMDTRLVSRFGSTPCKAAFQCNECLEPFDYFKCH